MMFLRGMVSEEVVEMRELLMELLGGLYEIYGMSGSL